ncbi:hypothetical protein MSG28_002950 [Choristoneura fumiferana]|uniref:Uncharacterized protein n=1 Tax=Choristoneura fumiferana TaxID=7141 RepID=A0ACC0JJZ7_CHOFU|nr:hypothetical protein MSG28_002950 [Choristoneura fumiferana]
MADLNAISTTHETIFIMGNIKQRLKAKIKRSLHRERMEKVREAKRCFMGARIPEKSIMDAWEDRAQKVSEHRNFTTRKKRKLDIVTAEQNTKSSDYIDFAKASIPFLATATRDRAARPRLGRATYSLV